VSVVSSLRQVLSIHPGVAGRGQQLLEDYNLDGVERVLPTPVHMRLQLNLDGTEST